MRRPDAAGVVEFEDPHPSSSDGTIGPTRLMIANRRVEVPAGTPLHGGCQGLYSTDVPCVGQVGLDDHGAATWVSLFNTATVSSGGPEHLPVYEGGEFSTAGVVRELAADHVVLRDGTWIAGADPRPGWCGRGDPVRVVVDERATVVDVVCVGRD